MTPAPNYIDLATFKKIIILFMLWRENLISHVSQNGNTHLKAHLNIFLLEPENIDFLALVNKLLICTYK